MTQKRGKVRSVGRPFMARQGDVLIVGVPAVPQGLKPRPRTNGRVVLAEGEATGHHHAIADTIEAPTAAIFDDPNDASGFFLRVESPTGLVHEEHARVELPAGDYKVIRQREWTDANEPRTVAD